MKREKHSRPFRELIFVEWCEEQECFHYERVEESLDKNVWSFLNKSTAGYVPVAVVESYEHGDEICAALLARRRFRDNPGIVH